MEGQALTQLLTIFLIASVMILFVLIVVFIILSIKKKQKENKKDEIKVQEQVKPSNIIQTKAYTSENVKKFMEFDEIKDNMIIQKNGKKMVMVVKCQGINYDLMSSIEKVSVEQGFIQFLNTLTRPIQLYIQARKINLEESIQNYNKRLKNIEISFNKSKLQLEQAKNNSSISDEKFKNIKMEYIKLKNLYEYTKDIIANTEKMSLNKNILTKNYYIAISYYPENTDNLFKKEELIDMAFSDLYTNAQAILRTLSVCGITGKILSSVELADLLYVSYNRDSSEIYGIDKAIKAGYDSLYLTAPDVVNKKIEELDRLINERATELANDTIDKVVVRNKREKELELKEKQMDELIKNLAQELIKENSGYIPEEIVEQSVEEIKNKKETASKRKTRKGA